MNQYTIKEIDPVNKTVTARFDFDSAAVDKTISVPDVNDVPGITTAIDQSYKQFVSDVAQAPTLTKEVMALIDKPVDESQAASSVLQSIGHAVIDTP